MARKPKHPYGLDGMPWSREDCPWGQQAEDICNKTGFPFELARDFVIMKYLVEAGDTRPVSDLMREGDSPGPEVLKYLAAMMQLAPEDENNLPLPYKLVVVGQDGRKPKDGELPWRDEILSRMMEIAMKKGSKYEVAPDDLAEHLGGQIGRETIRKAYDARHRKPKGN